MTILSIDPGITTGYCLISDSGEILESGNLQPEDLLESILVTYSTQQDALTVIVEDTPTPTLGKMNQRVLGVKILLAGLFPAAVLVKPGVWKTSLPIANLSTPRGSQMTQHEKDAYRLGMWYLIKGAE